MTAQGRAAVDRRPGRRTLGPVSTASGEDHRLYEFLFRTLIRHTDPEWAHHAVVNALRLAQSVPFGETALRLMFRTAHPLRARREGRVVLGSRHTSPFGLAAGFDKDGEVVPALIALGFGHVEVGTVTARPQPGNPKPRSFRLIPDRALVNRMGFNNKGAEALAKRLARVRATEKGQRAFIGVNIGKSKVTPLEDAPEDYRFSARTLAPYASYLAINVSSPNTPGLRDLQAVEMLRPILAAVKEEADASRERLAREVPVLVKIAPDLHDDDIRAIARLAMEVGLAGVIAVNTTIERPAELASPRAKIEAIGRGGLSGPILGERAMQVLRVLRDELPRDAVVISCGGVFTADDVRERMAAGADLVQGFTGLIYEGPGWPAAIARALRR